MLLNEVVYLRNWLSSMELRLVCLVFLLLLLGSRAGPSLSPLLPPRLPLPRRVRRVRQVRRRVSQALSRLAVDLLVLEDHRWGTEIPGGGHLNRVDGEGSRGDWCCPRELLAMGIVVG